MQLRLRGNYEITNCFSKVLLVNFCRPGNYLTIEFKYAKQVDFDTCQPLER